MKNPQQIIYSRGANHKIKTWEIGKITGTWLLKRLIITQQRMGGEEPETLISEPKR
jgi:hypothetical protein